MSVVSGNYFDLGGYPMGIWKTTLKFELSDPATHTQEDRSLVSAARTRSAVVDPYTGEWSLSIISTEQMPQDRFYTVTGISLDAEFGLPRYDRLPWQIRVPEGLWRFPVLVRDWSSPLAVGVSVTPPSLLPAYWLNPVTGDLSRKKA